MLFRSKVLTRGLNELSIHLYISKRVKVAHHVLLFSSYYNNFPLHWIFQHLMERRGHCPNLMNPRANQQARIRWSNIHHIESRCKSLRANFNRDVHLPVHHPFGPVKGPNQILLSFRTNPSQSSQSNVFLGKTFNEDPVSTGT